MKKKTVNFKILALSILIPQLAAIFGSIFTTPSINTWYASLNKPPITPPNWFFAPMWTTLFLLMGIALYFIWNNKKKTKLALTLFGIQLCLNALWSLIFFGLQSPLFGLIEIIFLWFFILITIIEFRSIDKKAAYLLIPYLAWVTIATILNFSIVWLNL